MYVAAKNWLNDYVKPMSIETPESRQTLSNFVYFTHTPPILQK